MMDDPIVFYVDWYFQDIIIHLNKCSEVLNE